MSRFQQEPKLPKMELIPPRNAEVEGVFRQPGPFNGRIIYTETVIDVEATKASARIKKDAQGNEIWKKHPTGEPAYPILVKDTKYKSVRYILGANNIGRHVKRIYNFEPTPAELAELARRDAERDFLREFVTEAVSQGLTPAQVVAKVKADTLGAGESPDAVDLDLTEEIVAQAAAELDADVMTRPEDEEGVGAITEAEKPKRRKKGAAA